VKVTVYRLEPAGVVVRVRHHDDLEGNFGPRLASTTLVTTLQFVVPKLAALDPVGLKKRRKNQLRKKVVF
jgi:hypothetical protein